MRLGGPSLPFIRRAVAWFRRRGVPVQRVLIDNGTGYRPRTFAAACHAQRLAWWAKSRHGDFAPVPQHPETSRLVMAGVDRLTMQCSGSAGGERCRWAAVRAPRSGHYLRAAVERLQVCNFARTWTERQRWTPRLGLVLIGKAVGLKMGLTLGALSHAITLHHAPAQCS